MKQKNRVEKCPMCGATYSVEEWAELPLVGRQFIPEDENGPAIDLEHRNCPCGNTLAVDLNTRPSWEKD